MLRSIGTITRTVTLCGALLVLPSLAHAGERTEGGGFGNGVVSGGRGGEIQRGFHSGIGEGRGVVVGGPSRSFERYENGRRYDADGRRSDRPGDRGAVDRGKLTVYDHAGRGFDGRDRNGTWREARRQLWRDRRDVRADGSFIRWRDAGRVDRAGRDPRYENRWGYADTGFRRHGWVGDQFVVAFAPADPSLFDRDARAAYGLVGPKILDVETDRLDRRPIGPSGLDVTMTEGGSKIIRVAPGYRMARAEKPNRRATGYDGRLGLQPWSAGWLRYCQKAHRSFDPDLGTYVTEEGRIAFCSAE